ncbi:MAG: hypothetical protein M5U19_14830 [Microthrixaceae bacterium]|nr:hypothetical protein [Microthrixaceae bacterium]
MHRVGEQHRAETEGTPSLRHTAANLWILHVAGAGRFEEAEELNIATRALGAEIGLADVETYFVASQAAIAMMRGTIGEMADIFAELAETYPVIASWRATQVICLALDGRLDEARRVLRSNPPDFRDASDSEGHSSSPPQPSSVPSPTTWAMPSWAGRFVTSSPHIVGRWTSWAWARWARSSSGWVLPSPQSVTTQRASTTSGMPRRSVKKWASQLFQIHRLLSGPGAHVP